MIFIILVKEIGMAQHIVTTLERMGLDHYSVTTSLKKVKDLVRQKVVNCIMFDMDFCTGEYQPFLKHFGDSYINFVPLKQSWNADEMIAANNAGMSDILTYDCSEEHLGKCIASINYIEKDGQVS